MTDLQRPSLPSASRLLAHILENPSLLTAVRELPGSVLGKLIDSVGLEDAAELVALASTRQLESVFDEDLWKTEVGGWEERFDPSRFALWLRAFAEAGEEALVARLTELPVDFVTLAVHRLALVIDIDALAVEVSDGGEEFEQLEKALDSCLYEEWEEFRLIARDASAWDDLLFALLALDRDHHGLLRQILERCSAMSSEWIDENGGLYEVLSSDQMLETDVRAERDDRRAARGFVAPADARAFLELARRGDEMDTRDAISRAYFRELQRTTGKLASRPRSASKSALRGDLSGLLKLLRNAQLMETTTGTPMPAKLRGKKRPKPVTPAASPQAIELRPAETEATPELLESVLSQLRTSHPEVYAERMEELSYLANTLLAAPGQQRRRLRPVEALEAAVRITNFGLEQSLTEKDRRSRPESQLAAAVVLTKTSADRLFRSAFHQLCSGAKVDVSLGDLPALLLGKPVR